MKRTRTRIKAAFVTATVVAGLAVATTPAQALSHCNVGSGGVIICEYGVSTVTLPNGTKQEFAIGTDLAVWTRSTNSAGNWSIWTSMGGEWRSGAVVRTQQVHPYLFAIVATGTDNWLWANWRDHEGNWTGWSHLPDPT
ncbi:hypothetical protein [Streptomyces sp. BE147]|uniref:hypothetical protein n=1 Tax=unclassified Streptomyces TaxID=2593676 RepID=UPI002E76C1E0|nr:hypothetical protein [Streptomyces sp. BE147]MEE1739037.1 hypothetical protein [Streptomyces sp. BE147]